MRHENDGSRLLCLSISLALQTIEQHCGFNVDVGHSS